MIRLTCTLTTEGRPFVRIAAAGWYFLFAIDLAAGEPVGATELRRAVTGHAFWPEALPVVGDDVALAIARRGVLGEYRVDLKADRSFVIVTAPTTGDVIGGAP